MRFLSCFSRKLSVGRLLFVKTTHELSMSHSICFLTLYGTCTFEPKRVSAKDEHQKLDFYIDRLKIVSD